MTRLISIITLFLLFCACGSKDEKLKIPENIIPPERMVSVIVDFHLVEASLIVSQRKHEDVNRLTAIRYNSVLKKHKITRSKFGESLEFYSLHMKEMHKIYQEVIVELSKTQSRIISK